MSMTENENLRLEMLRQYRILDTPAEQAFDDLVYLAAQICHTPFALISLIDSDRVWFKAKIGITDNEILRDGSFCAEAIQHKDATIVSNALLDSRFSTNSLVTSEHNIRFYAGIPLKTKTGEPLGTLCVLDSVPREISETQLESLMALARQAMTQLEHRHADHCLEQTLIDANNTEKVRHQSLDLRASKMVGSIVSIFTTNAQGIITLFNQAAQDMLGYSVTEIVGKSTPLLFLDATELTNYAANLSHELGRIISPSLEALVAKALTGEVVETEWTFIRKDTSRLMVKISATYIVAANGSIEGFLFIVIDITRRKSAELHLQNAERFIRLALDALSKQFCILDRSGTILAINKPWLNFEKERGSDLRLLAVGHNYLELLDSGLADKRGKGLYAEHIRSILNGTRSTFTLEYNCQTSIQQEWFITRITPFPDQALASVIVTHENITEHKHLQYRFKQALESAPNAIILSDESGEIVMINLQAERCFGYSRQELVGQPIETLMPVRLRTNHVGYRQSYTHAPSSRPMGAGRELFALRKDGVEFPVEIGLAVIDENDRGKIILSSIIDITDRKIANDKLKEALSEKEVLLKEVYHRVKNNLQVVSSLISLQAKNVQNTEAYTLLQQSANRIKAMALLHEKLYQSKDLARINVKDYVQSLIANLILSNSIDNNRIKIIIEIPDITLDVDTAIPCGLIINELMSNVIKHAFPNNREGEIVITLTLDQNELILQFSDNGIGFPANLDFKKTSSLGLQLVSTLTSQLDGQITMDRATGCAYTIRFSYNP